MATLDLFAPVDFAEAIAWAKARGVVLPDTFYGALQENAKGGAFTVSGLAGLAQIQITLDSLTAALEAGDTFADWQATAEGLGGLPDGRTETIFRNFMQQAYNAGRWAQFDRNKDARPYLMYSAIMDARTTTICRNLNGVIRAVDDPFWRTHSPQNHHQCRSQLISLSESQARARSKNNTGLNKPDPTDIPEPGWGYKQTGDDVAAGLAEAIAQSANNAPSGWLQSIIGFFASGWGALISWLGRLL